jgi:hypothetical protein
VKLLLNMLSILTVSSGGCEHFSLKTVIYRWNSKLFLPKWSEKEALQSTEGEYIHWEAYVSVFFSLQKGSIISLKFETSSKFIAYSHPLKS